MTDNFRVSDEPARQGKLSNCEFHLVLRARGSPQDRAASHAVNEYLRWCMRRADIAQRRLPPAAAVASCKGARESGRAALNCGDCLTLRVDNTSLVSSRLFSSTHLEASPTPSLSCFQHTGPFGPPHPQNQIPPFGTQNPRPRPREEPRLTSRIHDPGIEVAPHLSDESSLRDDPTLGHFDLVHTARREEEKLHKVRGRILRDLADNAVHCVGTAAWKTTEPTRMPARFTRTC